MRAAGPLSAAMGTTKLAWRYSPEQDAIHMKDDSQSPLKAREKHNALCISRILRDLLKNKSYLYPYSDISIFKRL